MTRLSRRDRLALQLAYEMLIAACGDRTDEEGIDAAHEVLFLAGTSIEGDSAADVICEAVRKYKHPTRARDRRLFRARLALLLRALLRADRGDVGPRVFVVTRKAAPWSRHSHLRAAAGYWAVGRFTPLWQAGAR